MDHVPSACELDTAFLLVQENWENELIKRQKSQEVEKEEKENYGRGRRRRRKERWEKEKRSIVECCRWLLKLDKAIRVVTRNRGRGERRIGRRDMTDE